ncbi:MAG: hypothetical protein HKN21_14390, partial [Candidatus Eisenbacteria bacterium]|nr:hypothetical protein [Candidatus Eisenbacteria bacterium]
IRFVYEGDYAGSVSVAGDFNGWNGTATPMTKSGDVWSVVVSLGPGTHEYKFVVDGQWVADPDNPTTVGDFGNSAIQIGPDGDIVQMKATSNTELSPKIYLGARYITLFNFRETQGSNPEWNLDRPDYDIDLDFAVRMNEVLTGRMLTNINNLNENVQLWETSLRFDRGHLNLDTGDIRILAFDNDRMGTFDDPLSLVGDVGIYDHAWGYEQQGVAVWKDYKGFEGHLLYSDNFRPGGTASTFENISATGDVGYFRADTDNNKDVLGVRVKREVNDHLRMGVSGRLDRGSNPGLLVEFQPGTSANPLGPVDTYNNTVEEWMAAGIDLMYTNDPQGLDLSAEFLVGESQVRGESGVRENFNNVGDLVSTETLESRDLRLDTSKRTHLGVHYYAFRGWHWRGVWEFEDHDMSPASNDSSMALYNRVANYKFDLEFNGQEWKNWPWEAGLAINIHDFAYDRNASWRTQLWFDTYNFWLEQGEHEVSFDRLIMLGGDDVVSLKPRAEWMFYADRSATVGYQGILNATKLGREPKYWETNITFHVELTRRLDLNTDSRWVRYDDPILDMDETFLSHFIELKYHFTPEIEVGLSWGVDPWVIDGITNEYDRIGRDQFLFSRNANASTAESDFLDMGKTILAAEKALEDETRFQLEAIIRY